MKKISLILSSLLLLSACGSDSDNSSSSASESNLAQDSYVLQTRSSNYDSGQIEIGNLNGDRKTLHKILAKEKSDYTIDTYKDRLYHIGRSNIDTIDAYDTNKSLEKSVLNFSANFQENGSANTYRILQKTDSIAYLIQYDQPKILQIDLTATDANDMISGSVDLSAYNMGNAASPKASGAIISGDFLFVTLQRLDENYALNEAYVAVIDISNVNNIYEYDTDVNKTGLKGIALKGKNPQAIDHYNGSVVVASRGDYSSKSGTIELINAQNFSSTVILDSNSLNDRYNNIEENNYYHFIDVAINSNNKIYTSINTEINGYSNASYVLEVTLNNKTATEVDLGEFNKKTISDITFSPNGRLWIGFSDGANPGVFVLDTDTNTQNQSFIGTEMPVDKIDFLEI